MLGLVAGLRVPASLRPLGVRALPRPRLLLLLLVVGGLGLVRLVDPVEAVAGAARGPVAVQVTVVSRPAVSAGAGPLAAPSTTCDNNKALYAIKSHI